MGDKEIPIIRPSTEEMVLPQIKPTSAKEEPNIDKTDMNIKSDQNNKKSPKRALFVVFGIILLLFIFFAIPMIGIYTKAQRVMGSAKLLKAALNSQNITQIRNETGNVKNDLLSLNSSFKFLGWIQLIPFFGNYWKDGNALVKAGIYGLDLGITILDTIEPYSDIIGFTGDDSKQAKSGQENAQDRVKFIVETIDDIIPKLDPISEKVKLVEGELEKINPNRYPEILFGFKIRENLRKSINLASEGAKIISESKPLLENAPYLLGIDKPRTYLLIFQNDKELRPTGGFITAYSVMKVDKGKFEPVSSDDIYNLDNKYKPSIPAPEPLIKYLKGPYLLSKNYRLRDMNFSPDFKESMDLFSSEAKKIGLKDIDGIIAVDTYVLVNLLNVTGQIGVPGFGNFSTKIIPECNCPQVIYELESFADVEGPIVWDPAGTGKIIYKPPNADNRKRIVGPLMNSVLSNALGQPKEKLPDLFQAAYLSLIEKHVLFYLYDSKAQNGVESFNIAGRIKDYDGDYLHINDSNLGGRKSNLYVTQEVSQEINVKKDGSIEKTVVVTYKNNQDYDGWLNSVLPNWSRIYVPKGSELISAEGFEDKGEIYEEFGKTVFSGGFSLRPKGVVKITLIYKLPIKAEKNKGYKLFIQKQPGLDNPLYTIEIGKESEEIFLKTDKEFRFNI